MRRRTLELAPLTLREPYVLGNFAPYYRTEVEGGQQLDVTVHGLEDSERVIVNCLPWSEYTLRPDVGDRYRVLAKAANATVVSIDNPGVGHHGSNLSRRQRRMLREGNLEPFAAMQYEALQGVAEKTGVCMANAALVGYSLGTIMAANLAPLLKPRKVVLIEPLGNSKVKPYRELTKRFLHDARRDLQYRAENPAWFQNLPQTGPPQVLPLFDYLHMMARGGNFAAFKNLENTDTTLVRGGESTVVTAQDIIDLGQYINADEAWTAKHENHTMLNSLGRIAGLYAELYEHDRI